jgi:hypothetical protein
LIIYFPSFESDLHKYPGPEVAFSLLRLDSRKLPDKLAKGVPRNNREPE